MQVKVCKYYNTGYCKYDSKCKFFHSKESCEGGCAGKQCHKRHPKACKYKSKCKRKSSCKYKHSDSSNELDLQDQVKALKSIVEELQKENMQQRQNAEILKSELDKVKAKLESKADKTKKAVLSKQGFKITNTETDVTSFLDNLLSPKVPLMRRDTVEVKDKSKKEHLKCETCSFGGRNQEDLEKHKRLQHRKTSILETNIHRSIKCKFGCGFIAIRDKETLNFHNLQALMVGL